MATTDSVARIIALSAMGGGGVSEVDYSKATNKPRINGNELVGDKTSTDLGLASIEAISNVVYEPDTGIMTFEKENGTSFNIDLPLELLVDSGSYDATTKEILLELANGDIISIYVGDLVDTYFGDEETIELFQEGGENKFRVKETLLAKIYDELNKRLKYKGHVNSKEDLPTAGQASGEIIDRKTVINSKKYDAFQNPLEDIKTKIRNNKKEGYNYFIGTQYGALNTNFPEIIEGVTIFNQWDDTSYLNMIVRVNASTSKPCVWVSGYPKTTALMKNGLFDDGTPVQASFGELLITQPAWIVMTDTYTSLLYVLGNIPEPIKYKYTDIEQMPFATNYSSSPSSQMIRYTNIKSIVTDGFVYNPGYKLFGFNDDETPYWITTTPSDINENDVYTVGANYDLVRGNVVEQKWEPLAPKSIEIDNNTITLSSENKIQARAIIDTNTNNANSFWTGTKAEYDALGVYDENTFYAITDEAASMQSALTEVSGYDAAKTQILKNINGTLTWVDSQ